MSMAKCKCDKIFDSDEQLNYDETGECCCDSCFDDMATWFEEDLKNAFIAYGVKLPDIKGLDVMASITGKMMDEGYRKVK